MKILIPGMDGYIGWALALNQLSKGNEICGFDNFSRRKHVEEMNSHSAIPILPINERIEMLKREYGERISFFEGDLLDSEFTDSIFKKFQPDTLIVQQKK